MELLMSFYMEIVYDSNRFRGGASLYNLISPFIAKMPLNCSVTDVESLAKKYRIAKSQSVASLFFSQNWNGQKSGNKTKGGGDKPKGGKDETPKKNYELNNNYGGIPMFPTAPTTSLSHYVTHPMQHFMLYGKNKRKGKNNRLDYWQLENYRMSRNAEEEQQKSRNASLIQEIIEQVNAKKTAKK